MTEPVSLEQFLQDRVDEQILMARLTLGVEPSVISPAGHDSTEQAHAVTEALDRWELLALASTAEHDGRPDLADRIRRQLAGMYDTHPDIRREWLTDASAAGRTGS